ncbi:MAG: glycosyltransferase [Bacteroidetes bacterium]|nr:glycosyltransferase [Bacteroidota bacterium]
MQLKNDSVVLATVVISYYKNIPNLSLVLLALERQSALGAFEVIVSEDDDSPDTIEFLAKIKPSLSFSLTHLSQRDDGFRKCGALNRAINHTSSDFIIFLDGDCIPHRHFVKEYIASKGAKKVLYGRRVMLSEEISKQILRNGYSADFTIFSLLWSGSKRIEEGLYLKTIPQRFTQKSSGRLLGCNMGICKSDLMAINGFDEDYPSPGCGEDTDIEWRLSILGVTFISMKFRAIVYHIHHRERFTHAMDLANQQILKRKKALGFFVCKNGLKKSHSD